MLSDIITDIVNCQPDMEMVGMATGRVSLTEAVAEADADVVVVGLPDADLPSEYAVLLGARPQTRLLGVSGDGRHAFLYELRPYRRTLGEVSPEALSEAIRTAVRPAVS